MDISTVIGLVICIGAVLGTILVASGIGAFIDVPSMMTVVFGMVGATFIKWHFGDSSSNS